MSDEAHRLLSHFLYSDTEYVFTLQEVASVIPREKLPGFESRFIVYNYPDYAGTAPAYDSFYNGVLPRSGLFGFSFTGTRGDTVYVFGAILHDGELAAFAQTPRSVPFENGENACCHRYVLGDAGVTTLGEDCMALITHRYEAIRTDTAMHSLFSSYANVISADTVVVCN